MIIQAQTASRIPREEVGLSAEERIGGCYRLAAKVVAYGEDDGAVLVHGTISGMGCAPNPHAWVVLSDGSCYDAVMDLELPADAHERFFGTVEEVRYTREEVLGHLNGDQTWGPWV